MKTKVDSSGAVLLDRFGRPVDLADSLMSQRVAWAVSEHGNLGITPSVNSLTGMTAWECAEGGGFGNEAVNNPLNDTQTCPGSWNVSPTGPGGTAPFVQGYPSPQAGLATIATTLQNGFYNQILTDLSDGADPYTTANDIGNSPWGTIGSVIVECVPESASAVASFWVPPPPPEEQVLFIKEANGQVYWFIAGGAASYWRLVPSSLASSIPGSVVISDPTGGWLALWATKPPSGETENAGTAPADEPVQPEAIAALS